MNYLNKCSYCKIYMNMNNNLLNNINIKIYNNSNKIIK